MSHPKVFSILHFPVSIRFHTFSVRSSTAKFSLSKDLFSFSPVGISPSVCRFSSSPGFVLIGLYLFLSDASGFSISKSLSSSFSPFHFLTPIRIFVFGSELYSASHSVYPGVFHSTECIFRRRLGDSVCFSA